MWRPNEVVRKHRTRAALLWVALIIGVCAYASALLANAKRRRRNPSMSFGFRDTVYKYPDMSVCLNGLFGCDEFFLAETCAKSSNTTEGGAPRATFIYDWFGQQEVSSSVEQSLDGNGWCINFKTSEAINSVGTERSSAESQDYFTLDVSWYPSGFAGSSTTCVSEEGSWKPHGELVFFYLTDPETGTRSVAAPMPYSCITDSTSSYVSNYLGIGLTNIEKLAGDNEVQYKTTSTTSSTFKTTTRTGLQSPYAHVAMVIHQATNSLEVVTEVDPLDIAEIFGNVGGFWDLIMIFWPIFFVAVSAQNPNLKPRNFRKSVAKGAEVAAGVTATTSARFSSSFIVRGSLNGASLKHGASRRSSSSGSGSRRGSRVRVGSALSRRGSFASTQGTSFSSTRDESFKCESNDQGGGGGGVSNDGGDGSSGREASASTATNSSSGWEAQEEEKNDAAVDQSSASSATSSADHIVKLADTK